METVLLSFVMIAFANGQDVPEERNPMGISYPLCYPHMSSLTRHGDALAFSSQELRACLAKKEEVAAIPLRNGLICGNGCRQGSTISCCSMKIFHTSLVA